MASGHVKKNEQLATTGPYAYCRNPLYLGSIIIAIGFAIASRDVWVAAGIIGLFSVIYVPVIRSEEAFLRQRFAEYDSYARRVPRLLPQTVWFSGLTSGFSRELYLAASRVQCIDRGRRNAGGSCCEDALVPRFMVNLLTRCFALITVLTAVALTPGVSGQAPALRSLRVPRPRIPSRRRQSTRARTSSRCGQDSSSRARRCAMKRSTASGRRAWPRCASNAAATRST